MMRILLGEWRCAVKPLKNLAARSDAFDRPQRRAKALASVIRLFAPSFCRAAGANVV